MREFFIAYLVLLVRAFHICRWKRTHTLPAWHCILKSKRGHYVLGIYFISILLNVAVRQSVTLLERASACFRMLMSASERQCVASEQGRVASERLAVGERQAACSERVKASWQREASLSERATGSDGGREGGLFLCSFMFC